jgi:hypothetical protein
MFDFYDLKLLALRSESVKFCDAQGNKICASKHIADADGHLIYAARRLGANGLEGWAQVLERGYEEDETSVYVGRPNALVAEGQAGELD